METTRKIIKIHHNGIGDSLQFSTLPFMFHLKGYQVWISDQSPFKSRDIFDLIWGCNRYITGISSEPANCGEIPENKYDNPCDSFIQNWEKINGLEPLNHTPIIYYKPKEIPELKDVILIDISCSSRKNDYDFNLIYEYISNEYFSSKVLSITFTYFEYEKHFDLPEIKCDSIFHYCDMIYSCKKFVCLNSGGHSLASAIKRFKDIDVDCLVTHTPTFDSMYAKKNFFYPNINYVWL